MKDLRWQLVQPKLVDALVQLWKAALLADLSDKRILIFSVAIYLDVRSQETMFNGKLHIKDIFIRLAMPLT